MTLKNKKCSYLSAVFNKHNVEFLCVNGLLYLSIISEYFRGQEQLAVSSEWRFLRDEKMDRWRVWMLLAQLTHISVPLQLSVADSQPQPFTITGFQPNRGQPERSLSFMQKELPFFLTARYSRRMTKVLNTAVQGDPLLEKDNSSPWLWLALSFGI